MSREMKKWIDETKGYWKQVGIEEGIEQGKKEGKEQGKIELALNMFKNKLIKLKDAAKLLGMSEKQFTKLVNS